MSLDSKVCQFCKKEIGKEAIKCPHCQEWLNKRELSLKNPLVRSTFWILFFITTFIIVPKYYFSKSLDDIYKAPVTYKPNSNLHILSHRIVKKKKSFSILGEIENKEKFNWESVTILVAFRDKSNVISSLGTGYINNLKAGTKKPFEVTFGCSPDTYDPDKHSTYTIEIESGRGEFKPIGNSQK